MYSVLSFLKLFFLITLFNLNLYGQEPSAVDDSRIDLEYEQTYSKDIKEISHLATSRERSFINILTQELHEQIDLPEISLKEISSGRWNIVVDHDINFTGQIEIFVQSQTLNREQYKNSVGELDTNYMIFVPENNNFSVSSFDSRSFVSLKNLTQYNMYATEFGLSTISLNQANTFTVLVKYYPSFLEYGKPPKFISVLFNNPSSNFTESLTFSTQNKEYQFNAGLRDNPSAQANTVGVIKDINFSSSYDQKNNLVFKLQGDSLKTISFPPGIYDGDKDQVIFSVFDLMKTDFIRQ